MINYAKGKVKDIIRKRQNCTEITVVIGNEEYKAVNYDSLTGAVKPGDRVLLNTTAQDLKLGSGGYHFVVSVNDGDISFPSTEKGGHIMKLRYTPLQFAVLSAEEQKSPYHQVFNNFESLKHRPVIIGELHSMLPPVVFNIKQNRPKLCVSYIMTDGGALPLSFSRSVAYLKEKGLIQGTVTFGQAFGGDFEAVNIYTALITAFDILKSDIAVVTMGPGITGTGTKYGFSGIEQGPIIDAVNTLGGRPIFIPRISFADSRKRHCGISHHSVTVLKEIAKTQVEIVIPVMEQKKMEFIKNQIIQYELDKKHKIVYVGESHKIMENLSHFDFKLSTMGRGIEQEREFFMTAGAAGFYASNLLD
ncbi:DUF3866 family protein [Tepidanaerobacter sp. GT38]|uniref:DUF3866 family protein n=1 Tax=Tepidanaerobacter sp. GT38 TaxID=2722793 RepID=UPI001F2C47E3|nr:DUF3866 family protein [Tepidanaerobacter sp. GT38]MCG1012196.1 DUF3866 family protein [Tepidanaerobacter sp. GT38]